MANVLTVGDILEVTVPVVGETQTALNILHCRVVTIPTGFPTDQDAANALDDDLKAFYKLIIGTTRTYRGVGVRILNKVPTLPMAVSTGGAGTGTATGAELPNQITGMISMQTDRVGKSQRSRIYLPFPAGVFMDTDNSPTAAYTTILTDDFITPFKSNLPLEAPFASTQVRFGVYHRASKTITDWTRGIARDKWAGQHRRGGYGKPNPPPF